MSGFGREATMIQHIIKLEGAAAGGARISLHALSILADSLTDVAQRALRLRVESRSNLHSKPAWLDAATDIQLVGLNTGSTLLVCEAPTLQEVAPALFDQLAFWEAGPRREQSALSLVEETLRDAATANTESDLLDRNTLTSIARFRDFLQIGYDAFSLDGSAEGAPQVQVTSDLLSRIETLRDEAPPPQRVVIAGTLDELTGSRRAFRLRQANGQSVRGLLPSKDPRTYAHLFNTKVVVDGEASFRLSGKVALITATHIQVATDQDQVFEYLPRPRPRSLADLQPRVLPQAGTNGMAQVFGQWPGDETDEELLAALKELK
jgi:hypothetical protein